MGNRVGPRSTPVVLVALLVAPASAACHRAPPGAERDAGHFAPPPHAVAPRASAPGESPLDVAKSRVSLAIIKDRDTASPVVATLTFRDGAVALDATPPSARLSVNLDSFDSSIPLRNERVRAIVFETSAIGWETGELTVPAIPGEVVRVLREKKLVSHAKLDGSLKIHGQTAPVTLVVDAGYAGDGRLWVKTAAPVQLTISSFGLTGNLRRLSSLCMHDSIDDLVNATVALEFAPR